MADVAQTGWTRSREKIPGARHTVSPGAARTNSATEMAKNAKWYHMTTERIRVSETSSRRSAAVTANSPAAAHVPGASGGGSRFRVDTGQKEYHAPSATS